MTTTDNVLLIILTSLLSLFFLLGIVALVYALQILGTVRRVVNRAEVVVDSVEAAADVLKDASGKMAIFKLFKNILDLMQHKE